MGLQSEYWRAIISGRTIGLAGFSLRRLLWLLRYPYAVGSALRNALFDVGWKTIERVDVPVISVGNLVLGGTGKTPCVEYLARYYADLGVRVALVSRGYGVQHGPNDEALLLEENLRDVPHLQDRDRARMARTAIEELESELIILDDGFQHRRLHRDLNIVLVDATNPWGYGYLFPRGSLREPLSALVRSDLVLITRADQASPEFLQAITRRIYQVKRVPVAWARHAARELRQFAGTVQPVQQLQGKKVAFFCGIGNPEAFRTTLIALGAEICAERTYPDHHGYDRDDIHSLQSWAEAQPAEVMIVTTQKDLVKIRLNQLQSRPLWALRIGLEFMNGQQEFNGMLQAVLPRDGVARAASFGPEQQGTNRDGMHGCSHSIYTS